MCYARPEPRALSPKVFIGRFFIGLLMSLLAGLSLAPTAAADSLAASSNRSTEPLLRQVARTGKLTAGTRTDAKPFAYKTANGQWLGYSIDLLEQIRVALQRQLRQPIQLELVDVNQDGSALLTQGKVDIVCGSTSISRIRALQVDFSVGYFVTGTQLLINNEHALGTEFTIGVIAGTTNQQLMRQSFPLAQFVTVESRATGLTALQNQRIDALASDGILLEAMRLSLADPTNPAANPYEVLPEQPLDQEFYACMLPQGDEPFRQLVNRSLLTFMQGVLTKQPEDLQILENWFGETGTVPIGATAWANLLDYFQKQLDLQNVPPSQPPSQPPL
jgi:polar amino acid transport system substrate-binding protein